MPLSPSSARTFITRRILTCEGFGRSDGQVDVEGRLVDVRGYDLPQDWRDAVRAGEPIHDMSVRLTIDDELVIHAVESVTDAAPYSTCGGVTANMQRLVGLRIGGGFRQRLQQLIGGTRGCTHIRTLLETLAGVAIHTVAGKHREQGFTEFWSSWGGGDRGSDGNGENEKPPALIDSCHSYAADGPQVERLFPLHYRPRGRDRPEPGPGDAT